MWTASNKSTVKSHGWINITFHSIQVNKPEDLTLNSLAVTVIWEHKYVSALILTRKNRIWWLFVAIICLAAPWVNATVMFEGRGTDEGSVSWDQLVFVYALAGLSDQLVTWLPDGNVADTICWAAGVGTAAVTVALKGWWKKEGGKDSELQSFLMIESQKSNIIHKFFVVFLLL